MKYTNWKESKLNNQYKTLAKAFEEEPSMEYAIGMNIIEDLLHNEPNLFKQPASLKQQIIQDKKTLDDYEPFLQSISVFSTHNEIIYSNPNDLKKFHFETKHILSFMHDFFNSIDRSFAKYFNRIYKERKNNLRLTTNNKPGYDRSYSYYIKPLDYAYINIHLTRTIDDFFHIIHEYSHTIADQMKYRPQYNKYPFIELLPTLLTEIAYDVFIDNWEFDIERNKIEVFKTDVAMLKQMISYSKDITTQSRFLSTCFIQTNSDQMDPQIFRVNDSKLARMINPKAKPLDEKISYVIPYMTMIELYSMYQEDPERAIYLTKEIIQADEQENYYEYLQSLGIKLNQHLNDFIKSKK